MGVKVGGRLPEGHRVVPQRPCRPTRRALAHTTHAEHDDTQRRRTARTHQQAQHVGAQNAYKRPGAVPTKPHTIGGNQLRAPQLRSAHSTRMCGEEGCQLKAAVSRASTIKIPVISTSFFSMCRSASPKLTASAIEGRVTGRELMQANTGRCDGLTEPLHPVRHTHTQIHTHTPASSNSAGPWWWLWL